MPEKMPEKMAGGGIMDRLASLQKHGEEEWKKRITPHKEVPDLIIGKVAIPKADQSSPVKQSEPVLLRTGSRAGDRPVSLGDRLSKLQGAQTQWQKKVGEKDTEKFTVAGKMERDKMIKSSTSPPSSSSSSLSTPTTTSTATSEVKKPSSCTPLTRLREEGEEVIRRTPKMTKFKGSGGGVDGPRVRPVSLFVESTSSFNTTGFQRVGSFRQRSSVSETSSSIETISKKTVSIPEQDDESIQSFFAAPSVPTITTNASPLSTSDFDCMSSEPLLQCRRVAVSRPRRNRRAAEGNPLRNLAARTDLPNTYTEVLTGQAERVQTGLAERETRRLEKEKEFRSSAHSHLADEARKGLQSKEDFSSVQLRSGNVTLPHQHLLPYRNKMLIQVKGRRFCQSRLVPPKAESLNSGDCFVLVTPNQVFCWQGRFSNVIERSRSAEIAACVLQKKDLGCKKAEAVETVEEEKLLHYSRENKRFWRCLTDRETTGSVAEAGPPEEDEDYEQAMVDATCVYKVDIESEELLPLEEGWGQPPKHETLKPDLVLVFDFGSEVYIYNGKNAPFEARKIGVRLAQELWSAGWDFTECSINPALGKVEDMKVTQRPEWSVLGKINSCMETVLFREKFTDWPDKSRLIGTRVGGGNKKEDATLDVLGIQTWAWADLSGVSGASLAEQDVESPDLELEGSHLGRGRGYYDEIERRNYEITTQGVQAWHVEEAGSVDLGSSWSGQFHSGDTYVVRWNYKVALTGRALKGGASKHSAVGRERCAYFFWQGAESKTALKGASALQTVELDSEKGPQLMVAEGREHAAFLQLWEGYMTIYSGRRESPVPSTWRMFVVQGERQEETFLKEVPCNLPSLRSRGVFLLTPPTSANLLLWVGKHAESHQVAAARERAKAWVSDTPRELSGVAMKEVEEVQQGEESLGFWEAVSGSSSELRRITRGDARLTSTSRLFHMSSVLGQFQVTEVRPDWIDTGATCPLLHQQARLYSAEQPALFMFDCVTVIYLWQGWQPPAETEEDNPNLLSTATGSGEVRWHAERRAAMATLLEYRRARYGNPVPQARLVWAGHEPREFINMFPVWQEKEDVILCNKQAVGDSDLEVCYSALSRTEYSWEELQQRPMPQGVDPARIEDYLNSQAFQEKFSMSKSEYKGSPRWKQIEMKKEVGLF